MSTAIALLSGKGGSGKTTLALSMADLLSKCGVQTLLVDCDLSTNGATYFYEARLTEQKEKRKFKLYSLTDLLRASDCTGDLVPINVESELDFFPSISEISDRYLTEETVFRGYNQEPQIQKLLSWARSKYEVILFDCQAGYTELLAMLLPHMDVDLFVLEADSISASAMRSLHLKIGSVISRARLYQVFNKTTPEEFNIYSKIVGTFFTNIGTLLFDWKIRQAFSRSQVPNIESTSAEYGLDLCDICKILLSSKTIQEKLEHLSSRLHYQRLEEERRQTEEALYNVTSTQGPSRRYILLSCCTGIIILLGMFIAFYIVRDDLHLINDYIALFFTLIAATIMVVNSILLRYIGVSDGKRKEQQKYSRKLSDIEKELKRLDHILQNNTID